MSIYKNISKYPNNKGEFKTANNISKGYQEIFYKTTCSQTFLFINNVFIK
jgi:hypothetical protein